MASLASHEADTEPQVEGASVPTTAARSGVAAVLSLQRSAGNHAVNRLLQRQQAVEQAPTPSPADLDAAIDRAIRGKDWGQVALTLNGFSNEDLTKRVSTDRRLKKHRRQLMEGALRTMIRWPPPQRVADAVFAVDGKAARLGRIDYIKGAIKRGDSEGAALGLNGLNNPDIRRMLPHDEAQLRSIRSGALTAMSGWSSRVTDPIDLMLQDPWSLRTADERILHVMERLVDVDHYPVNGAAGVVGNLRGESGVLPSRVEGSAEATPMRAPDFTGTARDFTPDEVMNRDFHAKTGPRLPGAGLAQWTTAARRSGLFAFRGIGSAILFDMDAQVDYLVTELGTGFGPLNHRLRKAGVTVEGATDDVLEHFEAPADPDASRASRRHSAAHAADVYLKAHPPAAP